MARGTLQKPAINELRLRMDGIKSRFRDAYRTANVEPVLTESWRLTIISELQSGNFRLKIPAVTRSLENLVWGRDQVDPLDLLETPTGENFLALHRRWEEKGDRFQSFLDAVAKDYSDRIIFDGESAFLLLRDFEKLNVVSNFEESLKHEVEDE